MLPGLGDDLAIALVGILGHIGGGAIIERAAGQGRGHPSAAQDQRLGAAALGQVGVVDDKGAILVEPGNPEGKITPDPLPPGLHRGWESGNRPQAHLQILLLCLSDHPGHHRPKRVLAGDQF